MTSAETRKAFLDFFATRKHAVRPSTPLIPQGDPTLMFNSAGMVPFKPYFLGLKTDLSRAASCQKCFRTTDIDRVGATLRHLTFFEMLGNFSFGDYFKEDAILWAWEFLTEAMGLDPKRLHPTVFKDDDEAFNHWKRLGAPNPPARLGEDTNFWNMGPTGPCGPCSEIYFDRGPQFRCNRAGCAPGCDCDRYLEVWNLVFTQFDRQPDGSLKPLPRKNIDTGMGLERLAFSSQGKPSPFDTDLFSPIVQTAAHILGVDPRKPETELAFRVIADHSRAATMLMAEGVIPSNVERGYVLRRLIRRAVRYGQMLGHAEPFLHRLVPSVLEIFEATYPDLREAASVVTQTLRVEEEKFLETLIAGEAELNKLLAQFEGKAFPGEKAFWLYETYGYPLELTQEVCAQRKQTVNVEGFQRASERAAQAARASWKGSGERDFMERLQSKLNADAASEFTGYESLEERARVVAFAMAGDQGLLVLDRTPFYPEGGGQVGDEGWIFSADGQTALGRVVDTQKQGSVIVHVLRQPHEPDLTSGQTVLAKVDAVRRNYVTPHHTATHLLNESLRRILGAHVRQAGSYVGADKLRFDFTNPKALGPETLRKVEGLVADEIKKGDPVAVKVDSIDKVKDYGAVTLLGESYASRPRFVLIGAKGWSDPKDRFSLELCGGTHVASTADVRGFKILKESSVAAGIRRIEALAGKAVEDYERLKSEEGERATVQLRERERELLARVAELGGRAEQSPASADAQVLRLREKELRELLGRLRSRKLAEQAEAGLRTLELGGIKVLAQRLEGADPKSLRSLSDKLKAQLGSGLVFLAAPGNGKLSFILAATPDLASKGVDAAKIAKAFAASAGGSAGGRADFAQGGCADDGWDAVLDHLSAALR